MTTTATRTVTSAEEWTRLWQDVQRAKPRELDAAREMAVAVFIGERRTGGYTVEIASIAAKDGKLVVEYRERTPAKDMMVTQSLTQPWAIAIVPRQSLPVEFRKLPAANQPREQ